MGSELNFFWPSTVYRCEDEYFIRRAWFHNELTNYFAVRLFSKVERRESIDRDKFQNLDSSIECIDFFDQTDSLHFIKNYRSYRDSIFENTNPTSDLYFIMYPYRKTSVLLANILSETDLTIWVKSDYVGLFGVTDDPPFRAALKKLVSPIVSFAYPRITERLFEDNIIFYTGDILYDRGNHLTQYGITSLSPLSSDSSRIERSIVNRVVFVGDESNQKGLKFLLKALVQIDRDLELTIIGTNELSKHIEYKSQININCLGLIYENKRFYDELAKHDILVMPSICERQGKVQIEAMSAGVVPVCSDSGGTYTTIDNNYNGLLFEEKSVEGLKKAIEEFYACPSLRDALRENGLEYAKRNSLTAQVEKMATIIENHYKE